MYEGTEGDDCSDDEAYRVFPIKDVQTTPEVNKKASRYRLQLPKSQSNLTFSYSDVVPIKHYHYLKEYDFQKNLPSVNPLISKLHHP
jgi:hypothetical protein